MKFYSSIIAIGSVILLSFTSRQHPIQKEWHLVAEEIAYLNPDGSPFDGKRSRLDSIKNEIVEFRADGGFQSRDGSGRYTLTKDSIHLNLDGNKMSFKYEWRNSKLMMENHYKETKYIVRSRLYLK